MTSPLEYFHKPVMVQEVLQLLNLCAGKVIVDCTVGGGGHTKEILKGIAPGGYLIGLDKDREILEKTKSSLVDAGLLPADDESQDRKTSSFYHTDYVNLEEVIDIAGKGSVDGILLDLGVSSMQLEAADRGFSFGKEGPLDMRMDRSSNVTAYDILKTVSLKELEHIIRKYGEDYRAKRIATAIVQHRRKVGYIKTTTELSNVIKSVVPFSGKKINPATLTFQALRIVVNDELKNLEDLLNNIYKLLKKGGRIVVISFHSLEDRIVKNAFRNASEDGKLEILTRKPLRPSREEIRANPRSRSAKLRASERI